MFEKTIPSKIFEYIAAQKPIIYGVEGIAREILEEEFKRNYYFKANNLDNLEETLNKLVKDIEERKYVKPDIEKLIANYSRSNLAKRYREIVEKV